MDSKKYGMDSILGDDMINVIVVQAKTFKMNQEQVDWMLWELSKIPQFKTAWSKPVRTSVGISLGHIIQ